jgi:hypothetical protein
LNIRLTMQRPLEQLAWQVVHSGAVWTLVGHDTRQLITES